MSAAALGGIAASTYFAYRDDVFTRPIDRQTNISSEHRIGDLRAQVDRLAARLDRDWLRAAKLEEFTDALSSKARNRPASDAIDPAPLPSPIETPSEAIVAAAQTSEHAMVNNKKPHPPKQRHARVIHKRIQKAPTEAGSNHAYAEPAQMGIQNY